MNKLLNKVRGDYQYTANDLRRAETRGFNKGIDASYRSAKADVTKMLIKAGAKSKPNPEDDTVTFRLPIEAFITLKEKAKSKLQGGGNG